LELLSATALATLAAASFAASRGVAASTWTGVAVALAEVEVSSTAGLSFVVSDMMRNGVMGFRDQSRRERRAAIEFALMRETQRKGKVKKTSDVSARVTNHTTGNWGRVR
jgi:hypothetical protein